MASRKKSVAAVIWAGVGVSVVVSVFLAPIINGGWCADAPAGGTSVCGSFQRSLVGIDTSMWVWLAAMAIVAFVTFAVARGRRRAAG
jgi:hypothetical protein